MQIIGHRGAAGLSPQNTLESFKKALELGVDWVELDVRQTQDGQLVIVHDPHTGKIAAEKVVVRRSLFDKLRSLRIFGGGQIPTLDEVITLVGQQAHINIEVKTASCALQVAEVIEQCVAAGYSYDHFMVSSFWPWILRDIHRRNSQISLGLLLHASPLSFLAPHGVPLKAVGFYWRTLSKPLVKFAKWRGLWVYSYTVNRPKTAAKFKKWGVDAIVTDHPEYFVSKK